MAENWEAEPAYRRLAQLTSGAGASSSVFSFGESSVKESDKDKKIVNVQFFRLTAVNYVDLDGKWYKTPWRTIPDVSFSSRVSFPLLSLCFSISLFSLPTTTSFSRQSLCQRKVWRWRKSFRLPNILRGILYLTISPNIVLSYFLEISPYLLFPPSYFGWTHDVYIRGVMDITTRLIRILVHTCTH